eukprot:m.94097 g.94097  ORF g.94097 m.94097 type:complete len:993 (+) comp12404_c1_seq2:160-3138(+)
MVFPHNDQRIHEVVLALRTLKDSVNGKVSKSDGEKKHDGRMHRPKFIKRLKSNFKGFIGADDSSDSDSEENRGEDNDEEKQKQEKFIRELPNPTDRLNWCISELMFIGKSLRRKQSTLLLSSMSESLTQEENVREEDKDVVEGLRRIFSERDSEKDEVVVVKDKKKSRPSRRYAVRRSNSTLINNVHRRNSEGLLKGLPKPSARTPRSKSQRVPVRTNEKMKVWMGKMSRGNSKRESSSSPTNKDSQFLAVSPRSQRKHNERKTLKASARAASHRLKVFSESEEDDDKEERKKGNDEAKVQPKEITLTDCDQINGIADTNASNNNAATTITILPSETPTKVTVFSGETATVTKTSQPNSNNSNCDVVEVETVANKMGDIRERAFSNPQDRTPIPKPLDFEVKKRLITRTHTMSPARRRKLKTTARTRNAMQMSLQVSAISDIVTDEEFFKPGVITKQKSLEDLTSITHFNESHQQLLKKEVFMSCVDALRRDEDIKPLLDVITPPVIDVLTLSPRWDLDMFKLEKITNRSPLACLALKHLTDRDLFAKLPIDPATCVRFFSRIDSMYLPHDEVVYHNNTHGADVMHSLAGLLDMAPFFTPAEVFSAIVAGAAHDVGHPGYTNTFLINTKHDFAIFYNDKSVLENFHIATAFKLMKDDPSCDILENFSQEEQKKMRRLMITMVLGTDMTRHTRHVNEFKDFVEQCKEKIEAMDVPQPAAVLGEDITMKERSLVLSYALHCADLGACTKPWTLSYRWSLRVLNEFWLEGDEEKRLGIPVGQLNEREGVEIAKSQYGFVKFVCEPLWQVWDDFVSSGSPSLPMKNLTANLMLWEARREYEKINPSASDPSVVSITTNTTKKRNSSECDDEGGNGRPRSNDSVTSLASLRTQNNDLTATLVGSVTHENLRTAAAANERFKELSTSSSDSWKERRGKSLKSRKLPQPRTRRTSSSLRVKKKRTESSTSTISSTASMLEEDEELDIFRLPSQVKSTEV